MGDMIQLNEAEIKGQLKDLVRGTVEETLNKLLDEQADRITNAHRYERNEERLDREARESYVLVGLHSSGLVLIYMGFLFCVDVFVHRIFLSLVRGVLGKSCWHLTPYSTFFLSPTCCYRRRRPIFCEFFLALTKHLWFCLQQRLTHTFPSPYAIDEKGFMRFIIVVFPLIAL